MSFVCDLLSRRAGGEAHDQVVAEEDDHEIHAGDFQPGDADPEGDIGAWQEDQIGAHDRSDCAAGADHALIAAAGEDESKTRDDSTGEVEGEIADLAEAEV